VSKTRKDQFGNAEKPKKITRAVSWWECPACGMHNEVTQYQCRRCGEYQ
jgi:predicted RNA-binding Zn-ribbon protein involved in translation (DUF1610 family)